MPITCSLPAASWGPSPVQLFCRQLFASNIRFRWEYQPGSDVYLVYSDGRDSSLPDSRNSDPKCYFQVHPVVPVLEPLIHPLGYLAGILLLTFVAWRRHPRGGDGEGTDCRISIPGENVSPLASFPTPSGFHQQRFRQTSAFPPDFVISHGICSGVNRDARHRGKIRAVRLKNPLVLDGKLDDAVYSGVSAVSGFVQQEPLEGEPATEQADIWIFFEDERVYIAARCWDSHPERMVANETRRDSRNIYQNESLSVALDTFYDRRNGFFFQTNPLGALREAAITDEGASFNNGCN